ncbi:MAG: COX15/CtaA family protein [Pseudomonadales bacterium]|nr:COX15/CtaA family protein [Pseudomonadales bacterium]
MLMDGYRKLVLLTILLAVVVIALGAYTRLSDAGLGCPDWPGCYGQITVPSTPAELLSASSLYPELNLVPEKAWKEMIHRYAAASLGLLIAFIFIVSIFKSLPTMSRKLPFFLLMLVIFQAILGLLTVTLKLQPVIVMGHLMGGFATLLGLIILNIKLKQAVITTNTNTIELANDLDFKTKFEKVLSKININPLLILYVVLTVLIIQIMLGGWLSANYAAPYCPSFPGCNDASIINFSFKSIFELKQNAISYEFGQLDAQSRMSIHLLHRIWAMLTLICIVLALLVLMFKYKNQQVNLRCYLIFALLFLQVSLGVSLIVFQFPLNVALLHNIIAVLLLSSLVNLICYFHFNYSKEKKVAL